MERRQFLRLAGAGLVTGLAVACTSQPARRPITARPSPTPRSPAPSGPPPWEKLKLTGSVVRPGESGYDQARLLYSPRFDGVRPAAVARCASAQDVQRCVAFAAGYGVPLALRSGGHSYTGASTGRGLVVDLSGLASVNVSAEQVVTGPGAQLVDVYDQLARNGRAIPAGSCATVGIAGLALGGGIGVLSRAWGLTCDNVTAVQIVTADGVLRQCDAGHDPDLFWACRGGGEAATGPSRR